MMISTLLASLPIFAMMLTSVLGGYLGQQWGRKFSLLIFSPIFCSAFICQALAFDSTMLLFGRFLAGAAGGLCCAPTAVRTFL